MKQITFCVLMALLSIVTGYSQISIGVGTNPNSSVPFEPANPYSYTQSIYFSEDINASGNITSLQWYFTGVTLLPNSQDVTVYLGHTTKSNFSSDSDWESINNLTLVYSGSFDMSQIIDEGWVNIPFTIPFAYNGTDNLVIAVKENHPDYDSYMDGFYSTQGTPNISLVRSSTSPDINPNPADPPPGYRQAYFPNVILGGIAQTCPTPFAIEATTIGTTQVTVAWQEPVNTPSGGSQYYVSTNNTPPASGVFTGTIPMGFSGVIPNLNPATIYYLWIRSDCGNGTFSPWSAVYEFATACVPVTTVIEDFNDLESQEDLPVCWTRIVRGPNVDEYATVEMVHYSTDDWIWKSIALRNGNTADPGDEILLVSPEISNLAAGTHRLKFSSHDTGGGGAAIKVQVVTLSENDPDASYTVLTTVDTESSFTATDYIVDFSNYTGIDKFIGFKLDAIAAGSVVQIDNVRWEPVPACGDVDLLTITVDETTANTATLSWVNDGADSFQLVYGPMLVTDPDTLTPQAAPATATATIVSLATNTDYKVWIRSVCTGGNGIWIGPVVLKTECLGVTELNENFDASTEMPECWKKIITGGAVGMGAPSITISSIDWISYSSPNAITLYSGPFLTNPEEVVLVSPALTNIGAGTHRLKFRSFTGSVPPHDDIEIVILNSNKNLDGMTVVTTLTSSPDMSQHIVDFTAFAGFTDTYIGIRMSPSPPSSTLYIDDIVWEPIPPCPDILAVSVIETETTTAKLEWTPGGNETAWQIAYGPVDATDPNLQTMVTSTTLDEDNFIASVMLTGLTPATQYKVWVRSNCGNDVTGQWSVPVTLTTDCVAIDAINENFDTTAVNQVPNCWAKILRGETLSSAAVVEVAPVPVDMLQSAPNSINIYKAESGVDDDMIIVSPELTNVAAGTHRLTFYATYLYAPGGLEVGTLDSNNADAIFTPLQDVLLTTSSQFYEVDFTGYQGTDTYIGIRINSSGQHTVAIIDNVVWEPAPACPHIMVAGIEAITDTTAEVIWEAGGSETDWQIVYDVATVTSPDGLTPVDVTLDPFAALEGLLPGTAYNLWIRSVCGSTSGIWNGPIAFTTDCQAVTSFSQNFDGVSTPEIPACWTTIKRGETLSSIAVIETAPIGTQSAPNSMVIYKGTSGINDDLIIVSPNLSNLAAGTHSLSFYAMIQNSGGELQIGTLDTNYQTGIFTPFENITPTSGFQQYTVDFSTYSGTDKYIGIRLQTAGMHTVVYVDDVVWTAPPVSCNAVTTINENFDTTAVDTVPSCWTSILRGPTSADWFDSIGVKPNGLSLPNAVQLFKGMSGPNDEQILVLPQVSNLNAGTHELRFSFAGPPSSIEVGTMNNNTETGVFTLKQTLNVIGAWTEATVDFTDYEGTDTYVAIRLNSGDSPFVSMFMDDFVWDTALNTGKFDDESFRFYPNPVSDILHLSYNQNITAASVYNLLGQEVMTKSIDANKAELDLSPLASGTYLVRVISNDQTKTFKVLKR